MKLGIAIIAALVIIDIVINLFSHLKINLIMATQQELTTQVKTLTAKVVKVETETRSLLTKVDELLSQLETAGAVTPELQGAVDELQAQVDVVDALVPDAPPTEPPTEGTPGV